MEGKRSASVLRVERWCVYSGELWAFHPSFIFFSLGGCLPIIFDTYTDGVESSVRAQRSFRVKRKWREVQKLSMFRCLRVTPEFWQGT